MKNYKFFFLFIIILLIVSCGDDEKGGESLGSETSSEATATEESTKSIEGSLSETSQSIEGDSSKTTSEESPTRTVEESDIDGDEIPDSEDNCPEDENPLQEDCDQDEIGDICDDENIGPDCEEFLTEIYVDCDKKEDGNGTKEKPFSTIQKGINSVSSNRKEEVTIFVKGICEENLIIDKKNLITIRGYEESLEKVQLYGWISIYSSNSITIQDMIVTNTDKTYEMGIGISQSNYIEISNCNISNNLGIGIKVYNSKKVKITKNKIEKNYIHGIYVNFSPSSFLSVSDIILTKEDEDIEISDNTITNTFPTPGDTHGEGIYITGMAKMLITRNNLDGNASVGIAILGNNSCESATFTKKEDEDIEISDNTIINTSSTSTNAGHGMELINIPSIKVEKNEIGEGKEVGILASCIGRVNSPAQISSNNVYNIKPFVPTFSSKSNQTPADGIVITKGSYCNITNNNIYSNSRIGVLFDKSDGTISKNTYSNNGICSIAQGLAEEGEHKVTCEENLCDVEDCLQYDDSPYEVPAYSMVVTWGIEIFEKDINVGEYSSLALDSNDRPHISYHDSTNYNLKYAHFNGEYWHTEVVDDSEFLGMFSAIAVDSLNQPHIVYYDQKNAAIKYAHWNIESWKIETIVSGGVETSELSLALDSKDLPHISYSLKSDENLILIYYHFNGKSWKIEPVDIKGSNGIYSSLALDSQDNPHIAYYDSINSALKYASLIDNNWKIEIVDSKPQTGFYPSLVIDSNDLPHISYYENENKGISTSDLKYAHFNGTTWEIISVDKEGEVGLESSIDVTSKNLPHISYWDILNNDLKHAFTDGFYWYIGTIDSKGDVGKGSTLKIDSKNKPHITYYDGSNFTIKYIYMK